MSPLCKMEKMGGTERENRTTCMNGHEKSDLVIVLKNAPNKSVTTSRRRRRGREGPDLWRT
jgi:hypothetical protein